MLARHALGPGRCRHRDSPPDVTGGVRLSAGARRAGPTAAAATGTTTPSKGSSRAGYGRITRTPVVECGATDPDSADDDTRVSALLDEANKQIERAQLRRGVDVRRPRGGHGADVASRRITCGARRSRRSDATPRRRSRTRSRSRSIPMIPETLRAVADFYINGKGERGRDALRLGLELAQRGSRRALARRRRNAPLAADLAVLEAQALNDLGRSDEALERIDAALRIAPGRGDALHEKGVALFDLSRFADAKTAFCRRRSRSSPTTRTRTRCSG